MRQGFVAGAIAGAVAVGAVVGAVALAAGGFDFASACTVPNFQYVFNGQQMQPTSSELAAGNPESIDCNGNSYVPIRFFADAMGATVHYDGTTQTISVTAAGAALASGASSSASSSTSQGAPSTTATSAPWKVTLTSVEERTGVSNGFGGMHDASGVYVVCGISIQNISNTPQAPLNSPVSLVDGAGNIYTHSSYATDLLNPDGSGVTFRTYNPNTVVSLQIAFDVPAGTQLTSLRMRVAGSSHSPYGYINL